MTLNPAQQNDKRSSVSRRTFLTTATAGAATLGAVSARQAIGKPMPGKRGRIRWRFEAQRIEETFLDGSSVPFFRYVAVGNTRSNGRLPLMQERENKKVSVSIKNLLEFPIQPTIVNYDIGPVIMPQETDIWDFTMPPEGTWIFTESLLGVAASSAGFAAAMISNPSRGKVPTIRDYYLLYQDTDDRWNNAIDNGDVPDESVFEPNYHTVNGLSFPHTIKDSATRVNCFLGEDVLLRIANVSNIRQSLHFHGYHVSLTKRNNKPDSMLPPKDTFAIAADSTVELVMPVIQTGVYPIHPHSLTSVTDNGLYSGGTLIFIDAQEV